MKRICCIVFFLVLIQVLNAQIITTVAGTPTVGGCGADGGLATQTMLTDPEGVLVPNNSYFFIADFWCGKIQKVSLTTGIITTFAGGGTGPCCNSGDGGLATNAVFESPKGMCFDRLRNLYISSANGNVIRKVDTTTGIISAVAGNPADTCGFSPNGDGGPALSAMVCTPQGLVFDSNGDLIIAEYGGPKIRKITTATGIISTIAGKTSTFGFSGDGGPAVNALLNTPSDIVFDNHKNLFITDAWSNRIRMIDSTGIITTIAGTGTAGYSGDGGPALNAEFNEPFALAFVSPNILLVIGNRDHTLRMINLTTHIVTTLAGAGYAGFSGDGLPAAGYSTLNNPCDVSVAPNGDIYIADSYNNAIRKITAGWMNVQEWNPASSVFVYPNPVGNTLTVHFNHPDIINQEIAFTDIAGNTVLKQKVCSTSQQFDLSALEPGTYILKCTIKGQAVIKRVVVQR